MDLLGAIGANLDIDEAGEGTAPAPDDQVRIARAVRRHAGKDGLQGIVDNQRFGFGRQGRAGPGQTGIEEGVAIGIAEVLTDLLVEGLLASGPDDMAEALRIDGDGRGPQIRVRGELEGVTGSGGRAGRGPAAGKRPGEGEGDEQDARRPPPGPAGEPRAEKARQGEEWHDALPPRRPPFGAARQHETPATRLLSGRERRLPAPAWI